MKYLVTFFTIAVFPIVGTGATLQLNTLKCVKTEDLTGADECELKVYADGVLTHRLHRDLNDGNTWNLGLTIQFKDQVELHLTDLDNPAADNVALKDDHDKLGKHTVGTTPGEGKALFRDDGANYYLLYKVSASPAPAASQKGKAFLTITSETGVFHSVCLFEYPDGTKKWFGFKPVKQNDPKGPGFVETANREADINHYVRMEVSEKNLRDAESMIRDKYSKATYVVLVCDCVSMTADVCRACNLDVPAANFAPFALLSTIRNRNTTVNYDDKPYPWSKK